MKNNFVLSKIKEILHKIYNSNIFLPLFICFISIAIGFIFKPYYQTDDDVVMKMIASGSYSAIQSPNEHLIFINILYGYILKFLYNIKQNLPWYDICFLFNTAISVITISYSLLRLSNGKKRTLIFTVLSLIFPIFFNLYQFSIFSCLYTLAGIFLMYSIFVKPNTTKKGKICVYVTIPYLLLLGGFIRFSSAISILVFASMASILLLYYNKLPYKKIALFAFNCFFFFVITVFLFWLNSHLYSLSEWKDYYKLNANNVKLVQYNYFFDFSIYSKDRKAFIKEGLNNFSEEKKNEIIEKIILNTDIDGIDYLCVNAYENHLINKKELQFSLQNSNNAKKTYQKIMNRYFSSISNEKLLSDFYNYKKKNSVKNILTKFNLSTNDYYLLVYLFNYNTDKYSINTLKNLNKELQTKEYKRAKLNSAVKKIRDFLSIEGKTVFPMLLVLILFCFLKYENKKAKVINISIITILLGLLIGISYVSKIPPHRVYFPLIISTIVYLLSSDYLIKNSKQFIIISLSVFIFILFPHFLFAKKQFKHIKRYKPTFEFIQKQTNNKNLFAIGGFYHMEFLNSPFENTNKAFKNENFYLISWLNYTPKMQNYLIKKFGTNEITPVMLSADSIIVGAEPLISLLKYYSTEKLKKESSVKIIKNTDYNTIFSLNTID